MADRTELGSRVELFTRNVLFSRNDLSIDVDTQIFINRVIADGGIVEDVGFLNDFITNAKVNNYYNDIVAAYSPSWGVKGGSTASDLYSIIGASSDIEQITASRQPLISLAEINGKTCLTFDGVNDYMRSVFTLNQPETVIAMGLKQITWTALDGIFDGSVVVTGLVRQSGAGNTPELEVNFAGQVGTVNADLAVGAAGHLRAFFENGTQELQIDNNDKVSNSLAAVVNMDGFTIGTRGDAASSFSHICGGAFVILNSAKDANYDAKMTAIYNFSKNAYGTP